MFKLRTKRQQRKTDPGLTADPGPDSGVADAASEDVEPVRPPDNGSWGWLAGPTPRGLVRGRWRQSQGWYEAMDRDAVLTSTRQAVPTVPAVVHTPAATYTGPPLGVDERTGQIVASDPFVLYRLGACESVNVLIAGDIGVAKSTLAKDHYLIKALAAGRQVAVFDRKRSMTSGGMSGYGEYGRAARVAAESGLRVTSLAFSINGEGATINLLDPEISVKGDVEAGVVGQDLLLLMMAELAHGPLTTRERWCLSAAHGIALERARAQQRHPVLSDVVEALFTLTTEDAAPHANLVELGLVDDAELVGWAMNLAMDLSRSDIAQLVDGPTRGSDGQPLSLDCDLLVIDTSDLAEGSAQLVLVMALMSAYVSSVWSRSDRESVVVIEEGYSADLPSAGAAFKSMAKRGRGVGVSMVLVVHHLSDIPEDSPMRSLIKETGVIHIFRQKTEADAEDAIRTFGLPVSVERLMTLPKGTHILQEGDGRRRPVRAVSHVQTQMDSWVTFTDDKLNARAEPPSPFPEDYTEQSHDGLTAPE